MRPSRVTPLSLALGASLFFSGCAAREPVLPAPAAPLSATPGLTTATPATATPATPKPPSPSPGSIATSPKADLPAGSLSLNWGSGSRQLTREQLRNHPRALDLTLVDQASHSGQEMTFRAVPMPALFEGIPVQPGETLEFDTSDGFSASLDPAQVFNTDPARATAYLAIEDPAHPWPRLRDGKSSAGPFYLIWKNPQSSGIGQEQWPFQLRSFSLKPSIDSRFPGLAPQGIANPDHPIARGYQIFLKNCFACHTLDGEGTSRMGPDLNTPHSPTEYMQEEYLRKLVRDPQSVRTWKSSRMSSFSEQMLPESDLDELIAYLRYKAQHRTAPTTP